MGLRSRTKRGVRSSARNKLVVVGCLILALGNVETGWHVAGEALRPGTTVSAQAAVALIAFFGTGVLLGGLFLTAVAQAGRRRPARPPDPRPRRVITADALLYVVLVAGWAFFKTLDLILVTPGETATLGIGTRLFVVACGFSAVVTCLVSIVESKLSDSRH